MQANLNQANSFELSGKSIHVTYTSTGISDQPTFGYRDDRLSRSFSTGLPACRYLTVRPQV